MIPSPPVFFAGGEGEGEGVMKTLLLTGGTGEIGSAILEKFKSEQYHVIAPSRQALNLEIPAHIQHFLTNLTHQIDAFVHCAGFNHPKRFDDITDHDIHSTLQINTLSFYSMSQYLIKHQRFTKPGAILAISSIYGEFARKGRFSYAASKHALNGMVKTLALELGPSNIKVNAVSPGFVDTIMTRKNNSAEIIEDFKKKIPLGNLARTEDIAEIVYFLCSDKNRYINGQCIIADGGYSIGGFQE